MQKNVIVIFGGAFNPPLNSHFSLAEQIINEYKQVEKILFVPVHETYEKEDLIGGKERYEMLRLVCDKNPNFEVSSIEIQASKALPTIETLRKIQKEYPNKELWFTIGADNLKELEKWKEARALVTQHKICVWDRGEEMVKEVIEKNTFLKNNEKAFVTISEPIKTNISSTFVRKKLKEGKSIRYLIPEEVREYIEKHQLFCK